ncbi:hypothetical protein FRB98_002861, partial [Tulasnella sp. 332]
PVGGGGFCDLFQGVLRTEGRTEGLRLAMKRPRFGTKDPVAAASATRRFQREADIWSDMRHANILVFYGLVWIRNEMYLVSPWMEKGDLAKFVTARLRFLALSPKGQASHLKRDDFLRFREDKIVHGIASGLAYLHNRGIIHGDLKAANVLLGVSIQPVICDFGLTKALGTKYFTTSSGLKGMGSTRWMAPELLDGDPKTIASDIYAFGMTIVEILAGEAPFSKIHDGGPLIKAIVDGQRPPLEPMLRDDRSYKKLWNIARFCWEAEMEDRPRTSDLMIMVSAPGLLNNEHLMQSSAGLGNRKLGGRDVTLQYPYGAVETYIRNHDWSRLAHGLSGITSVFTWEERKAALRAASLIFELLGSPDLRDECRDRIFGPARASQAGSSGISQRYEWWLEPGENSE